MKKGTKITLWVVGSFVALCIVAVMCADIIASCVVRREVRSAFAQMPEVKAEVGGIFLHLLSGSAIVKDITFCTNNLSLEDTIGRQEPGLALHIPTIAVWNIKYKELLRHKHLDFQKLSIDDLEVLLYMDEQHPESLMPYVPKDTTLEKAPMWLRQITARRIDIDDLSARLISTTSPLMVHAEDLSVDVRDIVYCFEDSTLHYNDSVYDLHLEALHLATPDGLMAIEAHALQTRNAGPLSLGYTRVQNIVDPQKMADKAREPITWIDMELNGLSTSAINPIRKAMQGDYTLDSLHADVRRMHVCRDERYAPKRPFETPQEFMMKIPVEFTVRHADAYVRAIDIYFFSTLVNCGEMHLKKAHGQMSNITNRPGAVWKNRMSAPFGEQGQMTAQFNMHMNRASEFEAKMDGKHIETHDINSFVRPLVGITCECHIDRLSAEYKGDKTIAKGEFCMEYHGLKIQVHKEDNIPYKIVTKNADTFTTLANSLIPKSNPTAVDISPRRYQVEWKRDEWKPYPLYVFGPCIDGVKKTMLPGLYVHKQAKYK